MKNGAPSRRSRTQIWENLELVMAIVLIALCILSFFIYQKNRIVFALCFFAAGLRYFFAGCEKLTLDSHHRRKIGQAICWYLVACFFWAFAVIALLISL